MHRYLRHLLDYRQRYRPKPKSISYLQRKFLDNNRLRQNFTSPILVLKPGMLKAFSVTLFFPFPHFITTYSRRKLYLCIQNAKLILVHYRIVHFSHIAIEIFDFSLLLPIKLSHFKLCDSC